MARAMIFDLDGTLVDSLADIATAMNNCLARAGLPPRPVEAYRPLVGEGMATLVRKAIPPQSDFDAMLAAMRAEYTNNLCVHSKPFPGIQAALETLRGRGVSLAVLSNKPDPLTCRMIELLFPGRLFAHVMGHRPEYPRKPDPSSALAVAQRLRVSPAECVFVGDTPIDMQTAIGANMTALGVPWGFRSRARLLEAGAQGVIDRAEDLLDWA